ncbi:hypothetical protein [Spiroplasma endosymbiont of Labia minor]|uniref:hypothetical protein n=1 Tax=Spiroplasma endosymbiont of Labia minor TaxID=3066305 RepID=UPI0030D5C189
MNIRFRRRLNFWWALISLLIVMSVFLIILFTINSNYNKMIWVDFIIEAGGGIGIFWTYYLIRFCFSKTRYPFVTADRNDFESKFGKLISEQMWFWLWFLPILLAIIIPVIYFLSVAMSFQFQLDKNKIWRIVIFIIISLILITNNISYLIVVRNKGQEITNNFDVRPQN